MTLWYTIQRRESPNRLWGTQMSLGLPIPDEPLLTITEVAVALRVSKMTIYRLVHSGELQAMRIGRSIRVPASTLREYLENAA